MRLGSLALMLCMYRYIYVGICVYRYVRSADAHDWLQSGRRCMGSAEGQNGLEAVLCLRLVLG